VFRDPVRLRDPPDTADIPQRVERWREMAANTTDEDYQKAYTALADAYERLIILIGDVESWLSVSERSPARQERETLARLGRSAYLGRPNRGDLPRSVRRHARPRRVSGARRGGAGYGVPSVRGLAGYWQRAAGWSPSRDE
jgi:hypothetical protein